MEERRIACGGIKPEAGSDDFGSHGLPSRADVMENPVAADAFASIEIHDNEPAARPKRGSN